MSATAMRAVTMRSGSKWRAWLAAHGSSAQELWLVIRKVGVAGPGISYVDALEEALCFGWIDSVMRSIDKRTYALRFSPRKSRSIWSESNRRRAEALTRKGLMTPAGAAMVLSARQNGNWAKAYSSKKKPRLPLDLRNALRSSPVAWKNFVAFANSYQTLYVMWVTATRRRETAISSRQARRCRTGFPDQACVSFLLLPT